MSQSSPELWWQSIVEDFTHLTAPKLPMGARSGVSFTAICINVPRHLGYLFSSFLAAGGHILKATLSTQKGSRGFVGALESVSTLAKQKGLGETKIFANATGLGAGSLVGDEDVFPTRGQTVLVKGESKFAKTTDQDNYVIPRPGSGTTILGGTRENGNWSTEVNGETTKSILEGCKPLAPELLNKNGEFEVLSVQCGLRPSRKGGPRVESQDLDGSFAVVHSYGHAGAGYQNAIGSARKVVRLVKELDTRVSSQAKL